MRHLKLLTLLFSFALLAGCATATPYKPVGDDGFGYKSQQIDDDSYRVSFTGNSRTSKEAVRNYLLYRAAELTVSEGGDYFVVVNQATDKEIEQRVTSVGSPFFSPFVFGAGFGGTATSTTTTEEYEAYGIISVQQGNKPSDNPAAYDARQVLQNLRPTIEKPQT